MKNISLCLLRTLVLLGPLVFCLHAGRISAQNQDVQVVNVAAEKYQYSPAPIHVKVGAKVQLKITATDRDHGFKIDTLPDGTAPDGTPGLIFVSAQDCWQLKKEETTTIDFLAKTRGTYTFRCCHTCGIGHRGMKGQIVVD
jgi:heme/copper-type cytochrome/quinol oxidase subunit 2